LGAFVRITLPNNKPGLVAAAIFAFVTSFDNFTASQFLVWDHTTLPVEIYAYAMTETDPTVCAISTVLILATIAIVVAVERWVGLETVTE
jgi:putative spermidine/putrescine transport system permease protein